jgi:hypothetical protein
MHVDNESAIKLTQNPLFHQRSKHIDIRHHFLQGHVRDGSIEIKWIQGTQNPADMLTKPLDHVKFETICQNLGLSSQTTHATVTRQKDTETVAMCATQFFPHNPTMYNGDDYCHYLVLKEEYIEHQRILEQEWLTSTYHITPECEEAWNEYIGSDYYGRNYDEELDDRNEERAQDMPWLFGLYTRTTTISNPDPWNGDLIYGQQLPDYDSDADYSIHGTML